MHHCVRKLARSDTGGPTLTRGLAKSPLITLMFTSRKDNNCILLSNSRHLHKHWKLHTNYYYCVQLCMQFPESISSHWGWKYKLWFPEWIKMTISVKTFHRRNFVFLNFLPSSNTHLPFCNIFFFLVLSLEDTAKYIASFLFCTNLLGTWRLLSSHSNFIISSLS